MSEPALFTDTAIEFQSDLKNSIYYLPPQQCVTLFIFVMVD